MNVPTPHLSPREIQVLRLAAEGLTAKATASILHLSESAVNLYICHARQKLGAKTKAEAIAMLTDSGVVIRDSIENGRSSARSDSTLPNADLHEMLLISNNMRHMLESMLIADVAGKSKRCDLAIWNDLAEKFFKMAAHACGYQIFKGLGRNGASGLEI